MLGEKLSVGADKRKVNGTQQAIDSIIGQKRTDIAQNIVRSRGGLEEVEITKENVVAGLKFIAEHQDMKHSQLIDELIALGCNFTLDDIRKQFPEDGLLFPGMKEGHIGCGASVIADFMTWGYKRWYVKDRFLSVDDDTSVYAFIRKVTGDETYTKEYVDSLAKKRKIKTRIGKKQNNN